MLLLVCAHSGLKGKLHQICLQTFYICQKEKNTRDNSETECDTDLIRNVVM